jgi:hypothetical protein
VNLSVDGTVITDAAGNPDIPCTQLGQDGAQIAPLLAGAHSFDLVGLSGGTPVYAAGGVVIGVQDGQDLRFAIDLPQVAQPLTATADLTFSFGSTGLTCTQAGLNTVRIFIDPNPDGSQGPQTAVDDVACTNGVVGATVAPLDPGIHSFAILGIRGNQLLYATRNPPSGLFELGLHTALVVEAPAITGLTGTSSALSEVRTKPRKVAPKAFAARAPDAN